MTGYTGKAPGLTLLTRKMNTHNADVCVGRDEFNECHDGTGIGGYPLGLVSDTKLSDDMVMLQRTYNAESKDTCVFPEGEQAKFCKSQKGAYGDAEDLGYASGPRAGLRVVENGLYLVPKGQHSDR